MKKLMVMSLVSLLFLAACEAPDEVPQGNNDGGTITNLCTDKSASSCDMKWIVQYPRTNFPQAIEIQVNGKTVFNECLDTDFFVNRVTTTVEIVMHDFIRLKDLKTKFSYHVKKIADCNEPKKSTTFDLNDPQRYTIEDVEGEEVVLIKN